MIPKVQQQIQATAQGYKTLPDGTPVSAPAELQIGFLMGRWGVQIMGPEPDLKAIIKADRALAIHRAFARDIKDRSPSDWQIITDTLKIIEGGQDGS